MNHVSQILGKLISESRQSLTEDARDAIREGVQDAQEGPQDDDGQIGLPLGWEGVEIVEP